MRQRRWTLLLPILLGLSATPAPADQGRIPLYEPTTITMPGSYVLTRNLMAAAGPALIINTEGVSVDLNGFEIHAADAATPAILFDPLATRADHGDNHFRLFGGSVLGGLHGLQVTGAQKRNVIVRDMLFGGAAAGAVRVENSGAFEAQGVRIVESALGFDLLCQPPDPCGPALLHDVAVQAHRGVQCDGVSCTLRDSSIVSLGTAVRVSGAQAAFILNNSILDCPPCFNPQPEPPAAEVEITDSPAVTIMHNTIRGSSTSNGNNHIIVVGGLSDFAQITGNSLSGAGDDGIRLLSSHSIVRDNLIAGVGGAGIVVDGDGNFFENNKISGCGAWGIDFLGGNDHAFRGNILLGNDSGAVNIPASVVVRDAGGNEQ